MLYFEKIGKFKEAKEVMEKIRDIAKWDLSHSKDNPIKVLVISEQESDTEDINKNLDILAEYSEKVKIESPEFTSVEIMGDYDFTVTIGYTTFMINVEQTGAIRMYENATRKYLTSEIMLHDNGVMDGIMSINLTVASKTSRKVADDFSRTRIIGDYYKHKIEEDPELEHKGVVGPYVSVYFNMVEEINAKTIVYSDRLIIID